MGLKMAQFLLESKAYPNPVDNSGTDEQGQAHWGCSNTPLHHCAHMTPEVHTVRLQMARLLLKFGADAHAAPHGCGWHQFKPWEQALKNEEEPGHIKDEFVTALKGGKDVGWPDLDKNQQTRFNSWYHDWLAQTKIALSRTVDQELSRAEEAQSASQHSKARGHNERAKTFKSQLADLQDNDNVLENRRAGAWRFYHEEKRRCMTVKAER